MANGGFLNNDSALDQHKAIVGRVVAKFVSDGLAQHDMRPVTWPNKSPPGVNRRALDGHAGAITASIKKPPGHDSVRPHTRLPVSQFRRYHHNRRAAQRFREAMKSPGCLLGASARVSHIAALSC
jgi:hypothetical protein